MLLTQVAEDLRTHGTMPVDFFQRQRALREHSEAFPFLRGQKAARTEAPTAEPRVAPEDRVRKNRLKQVLARIQKGQPTLRAIRELRELTRSLAVLGDSTPTPPEQPAATPGFHRPPQA